MKTFSIIRRLLLLVFPFIAIILTVPVEAVGNNVNVEERLFFFDGKFTLHQADGPDCGFSGAPLTTGDVQFALSWPNKVGTVEMKGSGNGVRPNLRCGDSVGDMRWTADYFIVAEGEINDFTGEFTWFGYLDGTGTTEWFNCEKDGEPYDCGGVQHFDYRFDVVRLQGSLNCSELTMGTIEVLDGIQLKTSGEWLADRQYQPGEVYINPSNRIFLDIHPVPKNCWMPLKPKDKIQLSEIDQARIACLRNESGRKLLSRGLMNLMGYRFGSILIANSIFVDCEKLFENRQINSSAEDDPLMFEFDLQEGGLGFQVLQDDQGSKVISTTADTTFGGSSQLIVSSDPDNKHSGFINLGGGATITPHNQALPPFNLTGAQQVHVTNEAVGTIMDLSQINLPIISRSE